MSTHEVVIRAGTISLDTRNVREALARLTQESGVKLHLTQESTIAFAMDLAPLDRRAIAVDASVVKRQIRLVVPDALAPLAAWLGIELARRLGGHVELSGGLVADLADVTAVIEAHEDEILAAAPPVTRPYETNEDVEAVLALVRLGRIVLAEGGEASLEALVREQKTAQLLYEAMLDHESVDDVFLSESEFLSALGARPLK